MIIVSDTSPVSTLFLIDRLEILKDLYGSVIIPKAVHHELMRLNDFGYNVQPLLELDWLQVQSVHDIEQVDLLRKNLGAGESEAIVLSQEIKGDLLLIDERAGTRKAKAIGLKTIGLLGVLVAAKRAGLIERLQPIFSEMETKAGFWVSQKLLTTVLETVGE